MQNTLNKQAVIGLLTKVKAQYVKVAESDGDNSEFVLLDALIKDIEAPKLRVYPINDLVNEAHQNAINKGWYEEPRSFGEVIALMHSELSEALEDHRNGRGFREVWYEKEDDFGIVFAQGEQPASEWKPCGIPTELADTVIRIFDTCGHLNIDLEAAIREKMSYNATRPQRHGGKKL